MTQALIINGPNLNLLGRREPGVYGSETLDRLNNRIRSFAAEKGIDVEIVQSNHEGEIVEIIQQAGEKGTHIILINPAAYTHTSVAIRDALLSVGLPVIEIHISNIFQREPFRRTSMISDISAGIISGFGTESYMLALGAIESVLRQNKPEVTTQVHREP